ncbi:MAG: phosphoribosyl-ATP pyrophosphohydrolase [Lachnotalea sp.]
MIKYDKLVRDKIPEIIEHGGKQCEIAKVHGAELNSYLENKLHEEVGEYIEAKNLEELADIMEVLYGLAHSLGYSEQDLNECRADKYNKRGGFNKGIILKEVW